MELCWQVSLTGMDESLYQLLPYSFIGGLVRVRIG